jgi:hypothetical protein
MARGNIYSRLKKLEASPVLTARNDPTTARKRLLWNFTGRALDAMAHVRRAPIDDPRWRYTLDGLRDESPMALAAYVAALTALRHPDEDEARELLSTLAVQQEVDAQELWEYVDSFARFVSFARSKMRGRGIPNDQMLRHNAGWHRV